MLNTRQSIQVLALLFFTMLSFATYFGNGGTAWIQLLTVVVFLIATLSFDLIFSNDSNFLFDPDADNWRRKTEGGQY